MISKLAIADINELSAAGVKITPEQIITLNALGCAVSFSAPEIISSPRVAYAGTALLHELTIQAERWFKCYAGVWWHSESLVYALAWACAHADRPGFFKGWHDRKKTLLQITAWYHSLNCTRDQFHAALNYVIRIEDMQSREDAGTADHDPGYDPQGDITAVAVLDPYDRLEDLARECLAAGLGLTPDQISLMTRSAVGAILHRWTRNQLAAVPGGGSHDAVERRLKGSAEAKYMRYLETMKNVK